MTFEEKTLKSERIYEGHIINLRRDEVTVQNGTSMREIVEHNGGAVLAAVTDEGKLVMVRQYRKAAKRVMLEVPAGKIDPGESAETTAKRELKEETCALSHAVFPVGGIFGGNPVSVSLHRIRGGRNPL